MPTDTGRVRLIRDLPSLSDGSQITPFFFGKQLLEEATCLFWNVYYNSSSRHKCSRSAGGHPSTVRMPPCRLGHVPMFTPCSAPSQFLCTITNFFLSASFFQAMRMCSCHHVPLHLLLYKNSSDMSIFALTL